uniref:Death domain-containing protein n=1 Tax=Trichogramma kaykai TaxID=54128 RepID=A0ABD2X9A9_9HYME
MIFNMEQYDKLISDVIAIAQDQMDTETLNNLKKVYCKNIRPRELETITNLETFLLALDKRNIISYDNTDILKIIGNKLKNKEITDLITTYNQQFQASETNILYHALTPMESIENAMPASIPNFNFGFTLNQSHFYSTVPPDDPDKTLKTKVTNCISNHIGKHWIYICRHLNLSESLIDELEIKFLDQTDAYKRAMTEALNEYFSKNPQNWKREVLDALKDSKRNDIKKKVEDIFHF